MFISQPHKKISLFTLMVLAAVFSFAQEDVKVSMQPVINQFADLASPAYSPEKIYYLAVFKEKIPGGTSTVRLISETAAIIKIENQHIFELKKEFGYLWAANNDWKFTPSLLAVTQKQQTDFRGRFIITASGGDALANLSRDHKNVMMISENKPLNTAVIECSLAYLKKTIAVLPGIIFIDQYETAKTEISIIGYKRHFNGINQLDHLLPGANGKNITVGVKEQRMEAEDLDLYKRVLSSPIAATTVSNHATVISSIIGGAGNSFYDGRGMANHCSFFPSSFSNLFADDAGILNSNKVSVQNHSYGTVLQQFYGAEALSYDLHTWQNKNFIHVFSAGNSGKLAAAEGKYAGLAGYANLTGNFKMAKNIIAVAATDNAGNVPAESSAGPAYDGRMTPQVTALGPNGTSDAAAVVSGCIAVMQQVYADSNSQALPPASLVKAVIFNTAEDIYRPGIDYKTGFGLLNSYEAVRTLQQKKFDAGTVLQNQSWTKNITVPANAAQLKITLAWTDTTASLNNNKALVNDLDLEVTELASGNIYKPWVLSSFPHADSLAKVAVRKRDSLNTAEQVSIALPTAGAYQVKVTGTNISSSAIPFNIAYLADTLDTFTFTNPLHTSDVNRAEEEILNIKWKTFVADTNQTGNLYISYDNGTNWQLLKQAHKIYTNQFQWPVKDTASTALLKMETGFGTFFSKPFIIGKVINTKVDFLCTDSFQLSWDKHVYANAYKIFALTDSPYLKPILTVTDTFMLFRKAAYPYLVYAVEPVLNNNIPAARSVANNIGQQGVACFYKTLYYNQLDLNNLDLVLELSAASFVDSVFFERVTEQGNPLQGYGGIKAVSNQAQYKQFVTGLPGGINYFRAKIKLKSGAVVYTDIIALLTSGKRQIVFYPNPAKRGSILNYVLMQGLAADNRLQFFDVSGRMIRNFSSMPTQIDISGFPPGIVIYKLFGSDNKPLETGKLVIY